VSAPGPANGLSKGIFTMLEAVPRLKGGSFFMQPETAIEIKRKSSDKEV